MLKTYRLFIQLYKLYGKPRFAYAFFILIILGAGANFFEMAGIILVYPLIMAITSPASLDQPPLIYLEQFFGVTDHHDFIVIIAILVIVAFIIKAVYLIGVTLLQTKYSSLLVKSVMDNILKFLFFGPYSLTYKNTNFADNEFLANRVISKFVLNILTLIIQFSTMAIISIVLIYFLGKTTFAIIGMLMLLGWFVFRILKKAHNNASDNSLRLDKECGDYLRNTFNLTREIRLMRKEDTFEKQFFDINKMYVSHSSKITFLDSIYSSIFDLFMLIIIFTVIGISMYHLSIEHAIVNISIFIVSMFRLFPVMLQITRIVQSISNCLSNYDVERLIEIGKQRLDYVDNYNKSFDKNDKQHSKIDIKTIELKDISFKYDNTVLYALKPLNITINSGDYIGIIGASGAGKTTFVDVLAGLYYTKYDRVVKENLQGEIFINGEPLSLFNINDYQKQFAYVTQDIKIIQDSFLNNITFRNKSIKKEKVIEITKKVNIYDKIMNSGGFEAQINQNTLSGGERQRIGLARALALDSNIIILDEATSAQDNTSENLIIELLMELNKTKTIIAIAHRINTLKHCNRILYFDNYTLIDTGTFDELSNRHPNFREILKLSNIT